MAPAWVEPLFLSCLALQQTQWEGHCVHVDKCLGNSPSYEQRPVRTACLQEKLSFRQLLWYMSARVLHMLLQLIARQTSNLHVSAALCPVVTLTDFLALNCISCLEMLVMSFRLACFMLECFILASHCIHSVSCSHGNLQLLQFHPSNFLDPAPRSVPQASHHQILNQSLCG